MALITDISIITDKMKSAGIKFYTVKDTNKTSVLEQCDDEGQSVEEAAENLRSLLNTIDGTVYVTLRSKNRAERNKGGNLGDNFDYQIRVGSSVNNNQSSGVSGFNQILGYISEIQDLKMQLFRLDFKHKDELRELKQKFEDESEDDGLNDILKPFMVHVMSRIKIPGQNSHAIAGLHDQPVNPKDIDVSTRINAALGILMGTDPDFVEHLEDLAKFAQTDKQKFLNILPMLKLL